MKGLGQYVLKGKKAVPCDDMDEWANMLKGSDRTVAKTIIEGGKKDIRVSTVFLGLDSSFEQGPPLIFETMVFDGELDGEMDRYTTWEEAEEGHKKMVESVMKSLIPKHIPKVQEVKYLTEKKRKEK